MGNDCWTGDNGGEEEARREDLRHAAALIAELPPHLAGPNAPSGPSGCQDEYEGVQESFLDALVASVGDAGGLLSPAEAASLEARPSAVGPSAQGWPVYIVRFIADVRPILEDGALLYTLGQAVHAAMRQFRVTIPRLAARFGPASRLVLTEPLLVVICFAHVRDAYHPRAAIKMESHVREGFIGYSSPDHPSGHERYLIRATVGRRIYVYVVDALSNVTEHFLLEGNTITPLPLPDWHDEGYMPHQDSKPVRSVTVH